MRNPSWFVRVFVLTLTAVILPGVAAADGMSEPLSCRAGTAPTNIVINGKPLCSDRPPVIENGRLLVPFRALMETLGATVDYDPVTRRVRARRDIVVVETQVDSQYGSVNGQTKQLDVPARLIGWRTFVPLRFVSEALDFTVTWDPERRMAFVQDRPLGPADSPWPLARGDAQGTGRSRAPGPRDGVILWRYSGDFRPRTPPVVGSDGTIYFGSGPARDTGSSLVQAVDPTGSPMWETGLEGAVDDGLAVLADDSVVVPIRGMGMARIYRGEVIATVSFYGGSVAGPVAALGAVHAGTLTGGVLLLDPRTLMVRGRADLPTNVFSVGLGRNGVIYARSAERAVSALRFRASNTSKEGHEAELLWQFELSEIWGGHLAVGPVDGSGESGLQVYFTDSGRLYALREDGTIAWTSPDEVSALGSPAIGPDGTVYSPGSALYAFDPGGKPLWSLPIPAWKLIVDGEGTIYVMYAPPGEQRLAAVSPAGAIVWDLDLSSYPMEVLDLDGMAIGPDRRLYLTSAGGVIAIGEPH